MNPSPAHLREALERLNDALGDVVRDMIGHDVSRTMTDAETIALTSLVESVGRRGDVLRIAMAAEIDDRSRPERGDARLSAQHGSANASELITRLTGVSTTTAKERVRLGRAVAQTTALSGEVLPARFPAVRTALIDGGMGMDSVSAIIRTLGPLTGRVERTHLDAAEHELVAAASGTSPDGAPPVGADDTLIQAKVWALVLDPDGALPADERAVRNRGLRLGREFDGLVPVQGMLLSDVAAQFRRLTDAHLSPRVHDRTPSSAGPTFSEDPAGNEAAAETSDDETVTAPDTRTMPQKLHDVIASVLGVAARAAETPTLGGAAPTLLVTVTASELHAHDGIAFIDGTDTVVPAVVARQVACTGGIQRIVFGRDGRIIELGGPQRVFAAHQRRAITARDGGCIIPGCHVPAAWCEIHHVTEHSRGGPTHTDNGVLLC